MLNRNTSLEEVLKLSKSAHCERGIKCCTLTPVLTDNDLGNLKNYFSKHNIHEDEFTKKYIEHDIFYGFLYLPTIKTVEGACTFLEIKKSDEIVKSNLLSNCRTGLDKNEVSYCKVQDTKPIACQIMHCGSDAQNTSLWFIWNYFVKGNPIYEAEFEKRNTDKYVWI